MSDDCTNHSSRAVSMTDGLDSYKTYTRHFITVAQGPESTTTMNDDPHNMNDAGDVS